jgi:probable F420-dependent oxidoreductase
MEFRVMRVGVPLAVPHDALSHVAEVAARAESGGMDGVSYGEMASDPMLHLTVAAGSTSRVQLMTNIIVAFARSPMILAVQARSLQDYSGGRLILGVGSQIKPHIERRFSMPWSSPAARMAEYIAAMRAIWHSWETGERLNFRGTYYTHTLMTPMFTPRSDFPAPKMFLAAVGERMTEVAGAAADGILIHPFSTARYLREVSLPAIKKSRSASASADAEFDVVTTPFVITGRTEKEYAQSARRVRAQIAFYGSTPAYRPVLALHGWEELADDLNRLSKTGDPQRWERMAGLVDEEVIEAFAVSAEPEQVGKRLIERFGQLVTRVEINQIGVSDPDLALEVGRSVQRAADGLQA